MINQVLIDQLIRHEGIELKPYRCTAGKLTIGVGRNLEDKGLSHSEALYLLHNDIDECVIDLQRIFDLRNLPDAVRRVLIDMRFNLGARGFRGFKKMINAVKAKDFHLASLEMMDSNWFIQTGARSIELVKLMDA